MYSFRMQRLDLGGVVDRIERDVDGRLGALAHDVPADQRRMILGGIDGSGGPQRPNAPSTRRQKGGRAPLHDTGVLATPGRYRVRRIRGGYTVDPPPERIQVIIYLRQLGYRVFEVSDHLLKKHGLR